MAGALMFKVKERRTGGEQRNTVKTELYWSVEEEGQESRGWDRVDGVQFNY